MGEQMNLRILTQNYAADPEIGFIKKSILKPDDRTVAMSTAWELHMFSIRNHNIT